MPYKDPFDDIIEVSYAFKGIYGVIIRSKKNITYSCFKFRRKSQVYSSHKFMKIRSISKCGTYVDPYFKGELFN